MYAKIFTQIFDSSIADNWKTRHVFEDLLKLADLNGVVDMTRAAIAARTRLPLEMVSEAIDELEKPDPESRTPEHEGRRLARLDLHRTWGWIIVNYDRFRKTASEEQRREKTAARTRAYKSRKCLQNDEGDAPVTHGDAPLTVADAGDAMQKQREMQRDTDATNPLGGKNGWPTLKEAIARGQFIGVSPEECEKFFHHYESMGWVDKNGNPIRNWQSKLAVWKTTQQEKAAVAKGINGASGDSFWKDKARFDMVDKELMAIQARASHTAMDVIIQPQDKANHARLKKERSELKRKLNLTT